MPKLCIACGVEFLPKSIHHPQQRFCSKPCIKREWKKRNRDRVRFVNRLSDRRCRARDPERYRFYVKNRRHKLRVATGGVSGKRFSTAFTFSEWVEMKARFFFTCPLCNRTEPEIKLTIDHIFPISKGGSHTAGNIQPLCHGCNSKKKDSIPQANTGQFVLSV